MGVFTLTLVRHGETQANKDRVIQGHQDTPLSERGEQQAQLTGIRLQQEVFTHAYSSDLQRAHRTCELILEKNSVSNCSVVKDARIRERKFGTFEGCSSLEFQAAARKHRKSARQNEEFPPGGETVKQLKARARDFFRDLCQKLTELESEISSNVNKRRRQSNSISSDVFPSTENNKTDEKNLSLHIDRSLALSSSSSQCETKLSPVAPKDSGHSSSGSTSSTSGCETIGSSLEHIPERSPVSCTPIYSTEVTSDISPSQESSSSSLDDSPTDPMICMAFDSEIQSSITAPPAQSGQHGCPNVSLSPIFEHRLSSISSISSGRNSSFDDGDSLPLVVADVLVVSHGGWIQQLLTIFVDELGCKIPGGKKYALQVSPNTGLSKFTCTLDPNVERPSITCLYIHDKDHLLGQEMEALKRDEV